MDILVCLFFLAVAIFTGWVLVGKLKPKVKCFVKNGLFTLYYRDRTIYVTTDLEHVSYRRKGSIEYINVYSGWGDTSVDEAETFIRESRTSILVRELFRFSAITQPNVLLCFDPVAGPALLEVQYKLKAFIEQT